ncbi:conserved hypothetical protein [Gloeothece citriformis PCC 7424]|uniref:Uncharacterized protein n=1 Tax=Gloeothece citriformis (strain PCC 7424) TaxID=65393 RepID=B7KGL0_GLOC7|nr:hypothetical protein [Gloeothece citriformis]ACK71937.1 conserved hypothetical protein [Gloeothece citriformis PCC 7424]
MFFLVGSSIGLGILILILFGILQWLQIPTGNLIDWLIGIASFWWLMVIVTVPWNVYFEAQEVNAEADISREKEISIDEKQVSYVKQVQKWSLVVAIALHILSALGLYVLAATGISGVGYISSGATLLLTGLRPAIRTYEYLAARLSMIRQQIKYPREDILELRQRFEQLENNVEELQKKLDVNEPESWATIQEEKVKQVRQEYTDLLAQLEYFQARNKAEHEQLSREAKNAIAQLTEDSQFLGHVREIIRFVKTA